MAELFVDQSLNSVHLCSVLRSLSKSTGELQPSRFGAGRSDGRLMRSVAVLSQAVPQCRKHQIIQRAPFARRRSDRRTRDFVGNFQRGLHSVIFPAVPLGQPGRLYFFGSNGKGPGGFT